MKKLFWLCLLMMTGAFAGRTQTVGQYDSTVDAPLQPGIGNETVFLRFSAAIKDLNKVSLEWDADSVEEGDYFIIERSSDGVHFETISAVRKTAASKHYEVVDMAPPNGSDLYRIKYAAVSGRFVYSKAIPLSLSGDVDFKFYPNPVDKLFIIRSEHAVDVQLIDASGAIRLSKRVQPGVQVINISTLEHGLYVLRVADKQSNRIVSHQLIKN